MSVSENQFADAPELPFKIPPPTPMTEQQFVNWCDEDIKAEWIDGLVIVMSPANYQHVDLTNFLLSLLRPFVETKGFGKILGPEFTMRLNQRRVRRVPDLLYVGRSRLSNLHPRHLEGPADLVVEVVSPDSADRDWNEKYRDYEAAGIGEYWIVDPLSQRLAAFQLTESGAYREIAPHDGRVASAVLPGFYLRPEWLWQDPLPKVLDVLHELLAEK